MSMKLGIVNIQPTGQSPPWGFFDWSSGSKVTKIISRTGRLISNSRVRTSIHTLNKICAKFGGPIFKDVETAASPPTKQDFRVYHCRFCVMRAILEKCIHPTYWYWSNLRALHTLNRNQVPGNLKIWIQKHWKDKIFLFPTQPRSSLYLIRNGRYEQKHLARANRIS